MAQYRNTLTAVVQSLTGGGSLASDVMADLGPTLDEVPEDHREVVPQDLHGAYRRMDQTVQQRHAETLFEVGLTAGQVLTSGGRLGQVVGACAADANTSNDAACLTAFIQRLGALVLREPPTAQDVAFFEDIYGDTSTASASGYAELIAVMLNVPEFLYQVEHGDTAVPNHTGVYTLSAYELAARLSYQLWDTMPDDALLAAAADGSLLTEEGYRTQVDRLFDDVRAQATMEAFFEDWLKVADLPPLDARNSDPVFRAFAAEDLPGPELRQEMVDDVMDTVRNVLWTDDQGTLDALLTTDRSYARGPGLAAIYGLPVWNGTGAAPSFPQGQRAGLFTRALFLTTGSANTRPIMKGVFLRRQILCDTIGAPPANANAVPPELNPNRTTREVVEDLTEQEGTNCAGCHTYMINPLGFATEGFDSLGRARTEQRLFDSAGNETGTRPVNTTSVPAVDYADSSESSGPADLARLMVSSGKVHQCLARSFFRFTHGRWDDPQADGCQLEVYRRAAMDGTLTDVLKAAVLTPEFRQRSFE